MNYACVSFLLAFLIEWIVDGVRLGCSRIRGGERVYR